MSRTGVAENSNIGRADAISVEAGPAGLSPEVGTDQSSPHVATVCQVLHGLDVGGAEVLAARLARQLRDDFRFIFLCLERAGTLGEELNGEGFPVHVLNRPPGLSLGCARRLAKIIRDERVDLIQAHQYTPFFYSSLCRLFGHGRPVLFTEHGRHHPDNPSAKRRLANRVLIRGRDRVVAVGEAVRQALVDNEGIPRRRVEVIYNGIPLEQFDLRPDPAERAAIRRELELEAEDFVVIQVARLDYLKDHATAIRTLGRVAGRMNKVRLVLVGEGPERESIESQIRERGLESHARLLGQRSDIPRLLAAADISLLTSISEGIPLTLIEAMAAGLPVVATRVGGIPEVVIEGQTGLLVQAGDDEGLADRAVRLSEDPGLCRMMGQNGRNRAFAKFSEAQMHAAYRRVYEEMMCTRGRTP